jgi:hypothetical protein
MWLLLVLAGSRENRGPGFFPDLSNCWLFTIRVAKLIW